MTYIYICIFDHCCCVSSIQHLIIETYYEYSDKHPCIYLYTHILERFLLIYSQHFSVFKKCLPKQFRWIICSRPHFSHTMNINDAVLYHASVHRLTTSLLLLLRIFDILHPSDYLCTINMTRIAMKKYYNSSWNISFLFRKILLPFLW